MTDSYTNVNDNNNSIVDRLVSPFMEIDNNTIHQDEYDENVDPVNEQSQDEIDSHLSELEQLRRQVNRLEMIINRDKDIVSYVNNINSIINLDIKYNLAWSYVASKLLYESKSNNMALNLDETKLNLLKSDFDKIKRIIMLIYLTRGFGNYSLEELLIPYLIEKELGVSASIKKDNKNYDTQFFKKLEDILNDYANKLNKGI